MSAEMLGQSPYTANLPIPVIPAKAREGGKFAAFWLEKTNWIPAYQGNDGV
ncbi:hypothetical protein FACS1894158_03100 [Betaproteobacteria bacterium]|nr:hypothetical protein FACS1894158_03100 [Betaproteobacteria bacterium]